MIINCSGLSRMNHWVATGDTLCSLNVFPRLCTVQPLKSTEIKAGAHSDKIVSRIAQAHIHGIYGQRWKQASRTIFSPCSCKPQWYMYVWMELITLYLLCKPSGWLRKHANGWRKADLKVSFCHDSEYLVDLGALAMEKRKTMPTLANCTVVVSIPPLHIRMTSESTFWARGNPQGKTIHNDASILDLYKFHGLFF